MAKIVVLGCGGSAGVPVIGCTCSVCQSPHSQNKRLRSSLVLSHEGRSLLIDSGPDLRAQLLRSKINRSGENSLDGLFITHLHYDHIAGIDELRLFSFFQKRAFPCLISQSHREEFTQRYSYLFEKKELLSEKAPFKEMEMSKKFQIDLESVSPNTKVDFCGFDLQLFSYWQGGMEVMGFRFKDFAYLPDIKHYDPSLLETLKGIKTLIIAAHSPNSSPVHLSVTEALEIIKKLSVQKAWITHMGHEIDFFRENHLLPSGVSFAYDGLEIEI